MYGLEAENGGGWCLPEAQLAIAGIQVARTIYDTLTVPNADGEYVPYLAESITSNDTADEWTIVLRDGIKFHDGSDLTAEVVKNNIDAFRGQYEGRSPLLFVFVFDNIDTVEVTGPLTLTVTTKVPWQAFRAYMYSNGRFGISAQAQLDDPDHCDTNLIGTGPFKLEEWKQNDHLTAVRNPDYWNQPYPYLDEIEYRPMPEGTQRLNAFETGEITVMHTSGPESIKTLRELADQGDANLIESDQYAEVGYAMLNATKPPFDNLIARQAMAYAIDRDAVNEIRNLGILQNASGPFGPGNMGYLEDAGYPEYDPDKAKALVKQYEEETGLPFEFALISTPDTSTIETAQLVKEYAETAGAKVTLGQIEQAQLISTAIAGDFNAILWRNHPGGDPDSQYVWWHTGSPVNFGKFSDPEIDRLLEEGRSEGDSAKREQIYQDLNRRFSEQLWDLWAQWTLWVIASAPEVHDVMGPDLPDGSKPFPGMGNGHTVMGIWVEQ
ncbi:MAG: ABC transporter substrate-binding protein [Acidimicrobiia bacterium]|nr:ABC transporter substrate-binding protein [Acidimicrobiia bacterium]